MFKKAFYPFLFAAFPVLFLYAYNIDEVSVTDFVLPFLVFQICTLIPFFLLRVIVKEYKKSAFITTYFLILFFTYGYARSLLSGIKIGNASLINTFILMPIWATIFIIGALVIWRIRKGGLSLTKYFNIMAILLLVFSTINIGMYEIKAASYEKENIDTELMGLTSPDRLPDIYYIILDGYARADTLSNIYNYDNSEFIDYLTSKGFYVASKSRSNYPHTILSLPSSLNMKYLNYLTDIMGEESADRTPLWQMLANSEVKQILESKGYRFVYIASWWKVRNMESYNPVYYQLPLLNRLEFGNFAKYLLQTTALAPLCSKFIETDERDGVLDAFEIVADIPSIRMPTFVLAHISVPHPPFVFGRDGNPTTRDRLQWQDDVWKDKEGYVEQVMFTNIKVKELVDGILSQSTVEPIIILQADHGSALTFSKEEWEKSSELSSSQLGERLNILNAYYLPQNGSDMLYDSITPVNSFRVVLNYYFGANYEILEDKSYWTPRHFIYEFFPVP